ncbi:PqqD family protein [Actinomadura fulvescens]|uniref:Coenzyme PQQ synthesis protein D n=1 Tax=Actinomadura fulvescens TaxID=46160 RepID=A0ABN3PG18_9ACTN
MEQLNGGVGAGAQTFRLAKGVRFRRENFGGLMFQRPVAVIYGLTSSACRTLELCDGTRDVESVVTQMSDEYRVSKELVAEHVNAFLGELRARGFVELTAQ